MKKIIILGISFCLLFTNFTLAFEDLNYTHPNYGHIQYAFIKGLVNGYQDNTFKPEKKVNRAEALKMILTATEEDYSSDFANKFTDVNKTDWFAPFVNFAVKKGIVSGDGNSGEFSPARNVNKAEFLKMILKAFSINVNEFDLSKTKIVDVSDTDWFAPFMKFGVKFGILDLTNEKINPAKNLTRGEVSEIIFKLLEKGSGLDLQILLKITENKLIEAINNLEKKNSLEASLHLGVAESFSNLLLEIVPDDKVAQASQKIVFSLKNLVISYIAGNNSDWQSVIEASSKAWEEADDVHKLLLEVDPDSVILAEEIKKLAGSLANQAREKLGEK